MKRVILITIFILVAGFLFYQFIQGYTVYCYDKGYQDGCQDTQLEMTDNFDLIPRR